MLAIETTTFTGSLALCEGGRLVGESRLPEGSRSAQSLAPAIHALLANHAWAIESLQLIAVVQGPGSFTGLRVGITTAKTLAYALGAEVIGIDTLEVLAAQAGPTPGRIYPVVDAQRQQLFTACFTWPADASFPLWQTPTAISDLAAWLSALQPHDVVIGPVANKLAPQLPEILPSSNIVDCNIVDCNIVDCNIVDCNIVDCKIVDCEPQASVAARLAWHNFQAGRRDSLWTLLPHYHRASTAEEKAAEKAAEKRAAQIT